MKTMSSSASQPRDLYKVSRGEPLRFHIREQDDQHPVVDRLYQVVRIRHQDGDTGDDLVVAFPDLPEAGHRERGAFISRPVDAVRLVRAAVRRSSLVEARREDETQPGPPGMLGDVCLRGIDVVVAVSRDAVILEVDAQEYRVVDVAWGLFVTLAGDGLQFSADEPVGGRPEDAVRPTARHDDFLFELDVVEVEPAEPESEVVTLGERLQDVLKYCVLEPWAASGDRR